MRADAQLGNSPSSRRRRAPRPPVFLQSLESRLLLSTTYYVDAAIPYSIYDGSSWNTPFNTLQRAINVAVAGDQILIAKGTYKPSNSEYQLSFGLKNGVAIFGGYAGNGAADPNARNTDLYPTILSGQFGTPDVTYGHSNFVLTSTGNDSSAILDGVTVIAGYGGISISSGSPTIRNTQFIGNNRNGAVASTNASASFLNCLFIGNSGTNADYPYGGAFYNINSSPKIINCTFYNNAATAGAAIYNNSGSSPIITNSIIWGSGEHPIFNAPGANPVVTYSDIQGGYAGTGNINIIPQFVRSPWIGPDGFYGTADDDPGDLRLRNTSPALDLGSNAAIPFSITTDRAGQPRIQNTTIDMGAYEGPVTPPAPRTLYVDAAATGANSGIYWTDAFTTLQSALSAAADGDTIRIAQGTYRPSAYNRSFALRNAVALYGNYAGTAALNPDARDPIAFPTLLSTNTGIYANKPVLLSSGADPSSLLEGLTVTALAPGGATGIFVRFGSLIVSHIRFIGCTVNAVNADHASPLFSNCVFAANNGSAIYSDFQAPTFINCTFADNYAQQGGAYFKGPSGAGSLFYDPSVPTFINSIIWNCGATPIFGNAVVSHSDIPGYSAGGNFSLDPQFVRSPWNGPDIIWGSADDDCGDLRLRTGSPALDAALNDALLPNDTTDIAGNPRIQNGTVDMGAYEGPAQAPAPRILFVDRIASGANSGTSWSDAFTNLQSALLAAVDGDTIRIADGTYTPSATDRTITFALKNKVSLFGSYAGVGAPNPDARSPSAYPTILSGNIGSLSDPNDNSIHIVAASFVSAAAFDGFNITSGTGGSADGTGLYLIASSPTVANCLFTDNSAFDGAAIGMFYGSNPTISNCTFNANTSYLGGAVSVRDSYPTLTNCLFTNNSASHGGAFFNNSNAYTTLSNCTFIGNHATGKGGAIYNYANGATVSISNSLFIANFAASGGAISSEDSTDLRLTSVTFSGNTANASGGALYSYSTLLAVNCLFSTNTAASGGAVYSNAYAPAYANCTFTANAATTGGALFNYFSNPSLTNCILWNNGTNSIFNNSSTPAISYSDIQGGYAGAGNINADPLFIRNPAPGDFGDLRLQLTSPAVDAGNNLNSNLASIITDLAGAPRFIEVTTAPNTGIGSTPVSSAGPIVDMGAYELAATVLLYNNSVFDGNDPAPGIVDDNAIALDKTPLLPGGTTTFANYSSYSRGINGILRDIPGLHGPFSLADFSFKIGNSSDPSTWVDAPDPASISSRTIAGNNTRIELIWHDNDIQNTWLQITVKGGLGTTSGLAADDVFYFGNAPGEIGNSASSARVDMTDQLVIRAAATASALINSRYDINRDGIVDATDEANARANTTWFMNELHLINAPLQQSFSFGALASPSTVPASTEPQPTLAPVTEESTAPANTPATSDPAPLLTLTTTQPLILPTLDQKPRQLLLQPRARASANISTVALPSLSKFTVNQYYRFPLPNASHPTIDPATNSKIHPNLFV